MNWHYVKHLYEKYERRVTSVGFVVGFVVDFVTFRRLDLWFDNIILAAHVCIVALAILLHNAYESGRLRGTFLEHLAEFFPALMQISFGALFSGFFIFYSRSGTLISSWPFLALLGLLLVGNEFFRKQYQRFAFHVSVFFTVLFTYAVFAVPILYGRIGDDVFVFSGFVSLALVGIIILGLWRISPGRTRKAGKPLFLSIGAIYAAFIILYFTNILPPIPLSIKMIGVYHSVAKENENYSLLFEPELIFGFFTRESAVYHRVADEQVYVFSSVFAPTRIGAKIFHRWSYYDESRGRWVETDRLSFSIVGGRDGGYRGFTFKRNMQSGRWRVDVVNERGQMLGRTSFVVVDAEYPPLLEMKTY